MVGHFGEWQLIFYGTQTAPISLSNTAHGHTNPTTFTGATTTSNTSADDISTSSSSTTVTDNIWSNNGTFVANVSTVSDAGVTSPWQPADQPILITNTTSTSNLSFAKDLSLKDPDAENSTELKSGGVLNNGTFVTLPPAAAAAAITGHVTEEENQTNAYSGYPTTPSKTDARVSGFVYELLENVTTDSERAYENASTPNVTGSDVIDDVTTSLLAYETEAIYNDSSEYTTAATTALESPMPALQHEQVY